MSTSTSENDGTRTGPRGGKGIDQVAGATYRDIIVRLSERIDRDEKISAKAFQSQLKGIKRYGRSVPSDLTGPTLIANGDRMVPSVLSHDLHRRIAGSELVTCPRDVDRSSRAS